MGVFFFGTHFEILNTLLKLDQMKTLKLLVLFLTTGILLNSCTLENAPYEISLEEVVSGYDLWYIDYHRTEGTGDIPFLSKAFTVSFLNGRMYANNNLSLIHI